MTPELSIILPTHSRPRELERCLNSIKKNVLVPHEILLISDVNDPDSKALATRYLGEGDRFFSRTRNLGPAHSRNIGLDHARGRFILIFDDDDEIPGVGYKEFLDACFSNPNKVSYGKIVSVEEDRINNKVFSDKTQLVSPLNMPLDSLYVRNFIFTQALIFPAHVVKDIRQDPFMRSLEDWEYLIAVKSVVEFVGVDHVGAILYKDYLNAGLRRGTTEDANNFEVILDSLYVYRRWRAPNDAIRKQRAALLGANGLKIDERFL